MAATNSSVLRALRVCEAVSLEQPVGLRELARTLDEPKSSVQRALESLLAAGWVVRNDEGQWSISLRLGMVGARAGDMTTLRQLALPIMERLRSLTDESVRLWAPDGDQLVLVSGLESRQAVRSVSRPPGSSAPIHATAAGKAILALLPEDELARILDQPLVALTDATVTDPDGIRRQLAEIRRRGWAQTQHEAARDVGAVAAAVTSPAGRPIAALALALPMHRLTPAITRTYGAAAAEAAAELTSKLAG